MILFSTVKIFFFPRFYIPYLLSRVAGLCMIVLVIIWRCVPTYTKRVFMILVCFVYNVGILHLYIYIYIFFDILK